MTKFFRENPTITFGLGLPLLLVVVFLVISGIPTLLVAPPQYDVLYATEYLNSNNGVRIDVVDKKVKVSYAGAWVGYQSPRLWRYNPRTGAVKMIPITLPPDLLPRGGPIKLTPEQAARVTPIDVTELANLTVDASSIAPDGYEFKQIGDRYGNDIFTGLFWASRYRRDAVLAKDGRSIRLPNVDSRSYYGRNVQFIGWVTPE